MSRIDKDNYYLDIAQTVLERSTCQVARYGAIIVRGDEIVATGYNGAPRGRANCTDLGYCAMELKGGGLDACRGVHAEINAMISAPRSACAGGVLYLVGQDAATGELLDNPAPCPMCMRMMINAGLRQVVVRNAPDRYTVFNVQEWVFDDDTVPAPPK